MLSFANSGVQGSKERVLVMSGEIGGAATQGID